MKKLRILLIPILYLLVNIIGFLNENITFIGYFVFLIYLFFVFRYDKINKIILIKIILLLILTHCTLLIFSVIVKGYDKTNIISLIHIIPYIFSAIIYFLLSKSDNKLNQVLLFSTSLVFLYLLNTYIPQIVYQKIFFDNITGGIKKQIDINKIPYLAPKYNSKKQFLDKDKILILDFWNNNCGSCFEKFPKFNSFYNKNKSNKKLQIFSVNVYKNEKEIQLGNQLLSKYNYDFSNIFIKDEVKNLFQIEAFPTVLVIKNNEIIFKGTIETLENFNFLYVD
jgi:thiol-disulfide isomerase/thioredoxin